MIRGIRSAPFYKVLPARYPGALAISWSLVGMPLYATPLVRADSPRKAQVLLGLEPNRSRLADQAIEVPLQLVSATFTNRQ
jgi:hypothetical protein